MRILVVNWQDRENPQAGGAEVHLHEIFGRLARRGHAVTLLCSGWPGAPARLTLDGIDVHRVASRMSFPAVAFPYFRRTLARGGYDVVVEDLNKIPLLVPLWGGGARRVVVLVHHLFGRTIFTEAPLPAAAAVWVAERLLGVCYRRVPFQAVSQSTADDLVARGLPAPNIRVIYQGVDSSVYTPGPGERASAPLFAYLGRLKRYKGVDLVIRAFARLARPDARLEIAGTGDHRPALEALVRSLALSDRVRFLGFISEREKLALLRRAWALVLASPKEGWGITNLEAAACGTPVVASNSPGLRESVQHEETGFLVPHGDVGVLCAALARLAASPSLVEEMGRAARRFAEGFTWERAAERTEEHLGELTASGG